MTETAIEELLIVTLARLIGRVRHVATGASSPIPGAAALLARHRAGPGMTVSVLGSRRHTFFTNGGVELFDCAGQGRLDVFFLGGGQIDGQGNVNLNATGGYPASEVRFPGAFGSAYLYFVVPRVFLFREEHSRRVFVPRVEFVSTPGVSPPEVERRGGPAALITGKCLFLFDRERRRFRLESLHPGVTLEEVRDLTGFDFDCPERVATTPAPDAETLTLLRGAVGRDIAEVYPRFAERVWRISPPKAA
ncbi:MAG: CoA synthetase [Alphaproteobacteria bacterium]|nr:CoA synthetase [Alphaproteobacteria bacterium]